MEGPVDSQRVWAFILKAFPILNDIKNAEDSPLSQNEFCELVHFFKVMPVQKTIQGLIVAKIEKRLRAEVAPEFWSYFKKSENDNKGFKQFYNAVKSLYDSYKELDLIVSKIEQLNQATGFEQHIYGENSIHDSLKLILKATLLSQLQVNYQTVTMSFYETALKIEDMNEENSDSQCIICVQESVHCNCIHLFQETNRKLGDMTLLEPLVGQTLTNLCYSYIYFHIQKTCKDNFDCSFVKSLEKWVQSVVIQWLKKIYCYDTSISLNESMGIFEKKLVNYLYNSYTKIRIDQLFTIIIEFPESLPALEDLSLCLPRTDLKPMLIKTLQKAMETRLLHPGVSTLDVITAYIATIRSLRVLDPAGLLLETVIQPIHQYLRSREDTVRCIVSSLTEDGPSDLAEELNRGEAVLVDDNAPLNEDTEDWQNWVPDPIETTVNKKTAKDPNINCRTADIISMLVNIYGSKELFVNEYRTLLADRLLSQYFCDTEKEIRYLELLKLRFGDSHLHFCEVMLKDIGDSKRINQRIKQDTDYTENDFPLSTMIVSQQFWPPFKDEKLELHENVVKQMKGFTSAFEALKGSRSLCWKNHLGIVNLEIELNNKTLNLSVSPLHATIMMHFQDKSSWELDELSKVMKCPPTVLRRKMGFWLSQGVLSETQEDVFTIQEEVENRNSSRQEIYLEEYESESSLASAQDQKEEEFQNIWSYITGMLMNLDSLPLERIHHMLKMFAFQGPTTERSQAELKLFLERKVKERQLVFSNNLYKLPK